MEIDEPGSCYKLGYIVFFLGLYYSKCSKNPVNGVAAVIIRRGGWGDICGFKFAIHRQCYTIRVKGRQNSVHKGTQE